MATGGPKRFSAGKAALIFVGFVVFVSIVGHHSSAPPRAAASTGTSSQSAASATDAGGTNAAPAVDSDAAQPSAAAPPARPGYIVGTAVFADGQPIPNFSVRADSVAGSAGNTQGSNGQYSLRITDPGIYIVQNVRGTITIPYQGQNYVLPLHPVDGLPDGQGSSIVACSLAILCLSAGRGRV